MQGAMRMRRIVICGLPDYTNAFPLHLKRHDIQKNVIEH
jgi:hypothetical protein